MGSSESACVGFDFGSVDLDPDGLDGVLGVCSDERVSGAVALLLVELFVMVDYGSATWHLEERLTRGGCWATKVEVVWKQCGSSGLLNGKSGACVMIRLLY